MASIFQLFGEVFIDNEKANQNLDKTTQKGKSVGERLGSVVATAGKVGTAMIAGTAAAVTGVVALASKTAEAGDRVDKMSQSLGLSRSAFQEWDYILSQSGMSIDSMGTGMRGLTEMMTSESKKSKEALSKLGLSFDEISSMSQEQAFEKVVSAMQEMEAGAEKSALAVDIFGRSGTNMLPLLNSAAGSVENLKNQAHELGMVMSDDAVDGAVAFTDGMDTIKRALGGAFNSIMSSVMPIINNLIDLIIKNMPLIQGLIQKLAPVISNLLSRLLPPLVDLAQKLLPIIFDLIDLLLPPIIEIVEAVLPIFIELINMLLPPIIKIVQMILPLLLKLIMPLLPLLDPILKLLQPFIDLLMMILEPLIDLLDIVLPPIIQLLVTIMNVILPVLTKTLNVLGNAIGKTLKGAFDALRPVFEGFSKYLSGIIDFVTGIFTGNWKKAWEGVKKIFSGIWDTLVAVVKFPINIIITGLNNFIGAVNKIKIPDWVPKIGGKGIDLPTIPKLKVGMEYVPYDDFPALLHKGERVLTAEENKNLGSGGAINVNIENFYNNTKDDMKKLAQDLQFYIKQERLKQGGF